MRLGYYGHGYGASSGGSGRRRQRPALEVQLDPANDVFGRDEVHATRDAQVRADLHRVVAAVVAVLVVPVADRLAARPPAAALGAAGQSADGAEELVLRV